MRAICARGKQAESPVRGKFTLVWWRAEVEERQERRRRGHSLRTGAALPEGAACAARARERRRERPTRVWEGVEDEGDE